MSKSSYWDTRYRSGQSTNYLPSAFLEQAIERLVPGRALDLACGAGRNSFALARRGWRVDAVDASPEALKIARSRIAMLNLECEFKQADLETRLYAIDDQSYDLIIDFFYLHRPLWPVIRSGLKSGGVFVAEIHLQDLTPGLRPMRREFLLDEGELHSEFADWRIEHYSEDVRSCSPSRRTARLVARRPLDTIKD